MNDSAKALFERIVAWLSARRIVAGLIGMAIVTAAFTYVHALDFFALPFPPGSDGSVEGARRYCAGLTMNSSKIAVTHFVCGWTLTVIVVITAAVALTKVNSTDNRLIWIACIGAAGYAARSVLSRADASTELAVATTTAQTLDHAENDQSRVSLGTVMYNT